MALTTRGLTASALSGECMGTTQVAEYEPVSTGENTEVKVPVTPKANRTGLVPSNYLDTSDDFITPGQRVMADCDEQNSFNDNDNDNDVMHGHLAEYNKLSALVKELPGELFVNRILLDYSQCDANLERTRSMLFDIIREDDDFPFDRDADLKRRLNTKVGDSVAVKLANDIHKLLVVIEGSDYSELRDMISTGTTRGRQRVRLASRTRSSSCSETPAPSAAFGTSGRPAAHSRLGTPAVHKSLEQTAPDECKVHFKQLNSDVSDLKAEILLMKQRQIAIENSRSDQIKSLKSTVTSLSSELTSMVDTIKNKTSEINKTLSCMKTMHADNIETLKVQILENGKSLVEVQEQCLNAISAQRDALNKISGSNIQNAMQSPVSNGVIGSRASVLQSPSDGVSSFSERLSAAFEKQPDNLCNYSHVGTEPKSANLSVTEEPGPPLHVFTAERMVGPSLPVQSTAMTDDWARDIDALLCGGSGGDLASNVTSMENGLSFGNVPIPENQNVGSSYLNNLEKIQSTTKRRICFADIYADIGTPSSPKVRSKRNHEADQPISVRVTDRDASSKPKSNDKPKQTLSIISTDDASDDDFENYVRKRTKRYYIGGFLPTITESKITSFVTRKGLNVSKVTVFRNKRRGTTVIRLNMVNNPESRRVLDPGFWPKGVTCRPWLSYNAYRRNNQNSSSQFSSASADTDSRQTGSLHSSSGTRAGNWSRSNSSKEWGHNQDSSWGPDWSDYNPFSALD